MDRVAIRHAKDLFGLDEEQMVEGYNDGRKGEPEPGHNRSLSYWHGWRNGRVDGKHDEPDDAMRALAREIIGLSQA